MQKPKHKIGHHLIVGGVFLWIILSVAVSFTPSSVFALSSGDIFSLSNQQRTANGLAALTSNSQLQSSAQNKAQHMLSNSYFAHTAPDGTSAWSFISASGYNYSAAAENLASSNQGASSVVQGWMNSSGHRANLLSSTYTEVGYGVVYVGDWQYNGITYSGTYFVVAHYGVQPTPPPAAPTTPPAAVQNTEAPTPSTPSEQAVEPTTGEQAEPIQPEEESDAAQATDTDTQEIVSQGAELLPVASVATDRGARIPPGLAVALATLAMTVVVAGVVLEVRWIRHHSHVGLHLPHLHS